MKTGCLFLLLWMVGSFLEGSSLLVHFEERHSGSFFHFAESLELEEEVTLILIDAHSDASAASDSDELRRKIRQVRSIEERRELLDGWRESGRVQVFDWIEPLMPSPFEKVLWLGGKGSIAEAREQVDRAAGSRQDGALGSRWKALVGNDFSLELQEDEPVVVSLDLDYFAGWPREEAEKGLRKMWQQILAISNLQGVSVALSRPWLRDENEARFLSEEMLKLILTTHNVYLRWEPFAPLGPDRSEEARRRLAQGEVQPTFDFTTLGDSVKDLILLEKERISVTHQGKRWQDLLENWQRERGGWWLEVDEHQKSLDERVRIPEGELPTVRVRNCKGLAPEQVRWFLQSAQEESYNVLPEVALGKQFADAGARVGWDSLLLAETSEPALGGAVWSQALDATRGWGSVKVWAEAETSKGVFRTPVLELRVYEGEGFRGALSEQFGLPYVFGVGRLRSGEFSGPSLGWGNDCANLIVWAWQRDGFPLPWCNPGQLRNFLQPMGKMSDRVTFSPEELHRGIMLDRGSHVAALWQDQDPKLVLDAGDLLIHQLGGHAEVISVSDFVKKDEEVRVWKRPLAESSEEFRFVGDINLDGVKDEEVKNKLRAAKNNLGLVANLECVLSTEPEQEGGRYRFSASPAQAGLLREGGVIALGLANNHALDCGEKGLLETRRVLVEAGIQVTGCGRDLAEALKPIRLGEKDDYAIFAVNLVNVEEVCLGEERSGVLCLPNHQGALRKAIREEVKLGRRVIVMVHWGREFTQEVTAEQRQWGRWLVEAGATRVVGSHPHVEQMSDHWLGYRVDFSLGDLVFPRS